MKYRGLVCPSLTLSLACLCAIEPGTAQPQPVEGVRLQLEIERFAGAGGENKDGMRLEVFTARPHLVAGAGFVLLAPEHPKLRELTAPTLWDQVKSYVEEAKKKPFTERTDPGRKISGVFLGTYALGPLTGWRIPLWVSSYVAGDYPANALLGIPAHDPWQFAFARAHAIDVVPVIRLKAENGEPAGKALRKAYTGAGTLMDSGPLTGLEVTDAKGSKNPAFAAAVQWLTGNGKGVAVEGVDYRVWAQAMRKTAVEPKMASKQKKPAPATKAEVKVAATPAGGKPEAPAASKPGTEPMPVPAAVTEEVRAEVLCEPVAEEVAACASAEKEDLVASWMRWLGLSGARLNMMVDRCWLFSKPRMGSRDEADLTPLFVADSGCPVIAAGK